jgi:ABC-2 type transport system permease protein
MVALALHQRPKLITGTAFIATVIFITIGVVSGTKPIGSINPTQNIIKIIAAAFSFIVPIFSIFGSYGAIVREKTTGSIRFLLGLPNSRFDAYVGKFISRLSVVIGSLAVGIGLVSITLFFAFGWHPVWLMIKLGVITIPLAVIFVGFGLLASVFAESDSHAMAIALGTFVLFRIGWPAIQSLLVKNPFSDPHYEPGYFWVGRINPLNAYAKVLTSLFSKAPRTNPLITVPGDSIAPTAQSMGFAISMLIFWSVVPVLLGFLIFKWRDIL